MFERSVPLGGEVLEVCWSPLSIVLRSLLTSIRSFLQQEKAPQPAVSSTNVVMVHLPVPRLLSRANSPFPGGYMLIMQTTDAAARKSYIESNNLAKVIWTHPTPTSMAVQYHPKGIPGGVIPELDSQLPTEAFPNPLQTKISPWHACGPDEKAYMASMQKHAHLSLLGAVCRIKPSDPGSELAATQWQDTFGVGRVRDLLGFTNARVGFVRGEEGKAEGIISVTVGVHGQKRKDAILARARERGLVGEDGGVEMVGVRWNFSLTGDEGFGSKL